jgi:hypothetical protein
VHDLPPFPVDDTTLGLVHTAINPPPGCDRTSLLDLCSIMSQLAGADPDATERTCAAGHTVMRDPTYHPYDIITALLDEVRRLRGRDTDA